MFGLAALQPGYWGMECVAGHRYGLYVLWCRCLQPAYRGMGCVAGHNYGRYVPYAAAFNQPIGEWDIAGHNYGRYVP